ncbi:bifunctional tetrahydrofolate synthase/dihydrofolate synthase [Aidingimonas lacisalsi]|uniref:bifunctional tetrahydrofolate synthase/dihydrofolate synthase n=1 Tax=Aidingimonas lacisalsi TaxID=2604086 RepID=UPI002ED5603C
MQQPMSLEAWLRQIEHRHPISIDLGLERVTTVAQRLGLMENSLATHVVTVAGTNGKGSTVAMVEALGRAHGLTTATYTSPHLVRYNERVRLNAQEASDTRLVEAFERVEAARVDGEPVSLTYFEVGTLVAFCLIADDHPDLAVLEVGLGGRLDAVNIVDPDVAVVTTIAHDHAAFLGNDLEAIGREKAGILRPHRPVVLGSRELPDSVHEVVAALQVERHWLGADMTWSLDPPGTSDAVDDGDPLACWTWRGCDIDGQSRTLVGLPDPQLPLDNAAVALQALSLCGVVLDNERCRQALSTVQLPGRMQWLGQWCLDVAHNPHAASYVASRLSMQPCQGRRIALLGMVDDKDADGVIDVLAPVIDAWVPVSLTGERGREARSLAARLEAANCRVFHQATSPAAGAAWLLEHVNGQDQVLVCGSFFTVAEVLNADLLSATVDGAQPRPDHPGRTG